MNKERYTDGIINMNAILPTCKNSGYQLHWGMKIFAAFGVFLALGVLKISTGWQYLFFLFASPIFIIMCIGSLFVKYEINDYSARSFIGPFTIRRIRWDDVSLIYDDNFSSAHFYTFRLRNRSYWSSFGYNNACTNYKDFLRESILRVRPDTKVDLKILMLIGLRSSDIGKLHKPSAVT